MFILNYNNINDNLKKLNNSIYIIDNIIILESL